MLEIPLSAIPNQSLSIRLDNFQYNLRIYFLGTVMAMDITRDGNVILTGQRLVPSYLVIPYEYLEAGNFAFVTDDDDYPDYTKFGITQFLYYLSESELAALRAGT